MGLDAAVNLLGGFPTAVGKDQSSKMRDREHESRRELGLDVKLMWSQIETMGMGMVLYGSRQRSEIRDQR